MKTAPRWWWADDAAKPSLVALMPADNRQSPQRPPNWRSILAQRKPDCANRMHCVLVTLCRELHSSSRFLFEQPLIVQRLRCVSEATQVLLGISGLCDCSAFHARICNLEAINPVKWRAWCGTGSAIGWNLWESEAKSFHHLWYEIRKS